MVRRLATLALLVSAIQAAQSTPLNVSGTESGTTDSASTPPPVACPAGAPIGSVSLRVQSPSNPNTLPFQNINHLSEGDTVLYSPILRGKEKRPGEVSLVMVPAMRQPKAPALLVTAPKPAGKDQVWGIPSP